MDAEHADKLRRKLDDLLAENAYLLVRLRYTELKVIQEPAAWKKLFTESKIIVAQQNKELATLKKQVEIAVEALEFYANTLAQETLSKLKEATK